VLSAHAGTGRPRPDPDNNAHPASSSSFRSERLIAAAAEVQAVAATPE
jgi:hypothetical protein